MSASGSVSFGFGQRHRVERVIEFVLEVFEITGYHTASGTVANRIEAEFLFVHPEIFSAFSSVDIIDSAIFCKQL